MTDLTLRPYDPDHDTDLMEGELARVCADLNASRAKTARLADRRAMLIDRLSAQGVPPRRLSALTGLTRARIHAIRHSRAA